MNPFNILSCIFLGVTLFACRKNEARPTLSLSDSTLLLDSSITLPGAAMTDTITINAGLAWKASISASWIHLDTTQGVGVYRLKVSVDTNKTGAVLTGSVTLTPLNNSNAAAITIKIKQNPFYGILNFTPLGGRLGSNITLNGYFPADGNYTITVGNSSNATIVSHSPTQIVITVPPDAATGGTLLVTVPNLAPALASAQPFTVLSDWKLLTTSSGMITNAQPGLTYTYNGSLYFGWSTTNDQNIYRLDTTTARWVAAITIPSGIQVTQQPTYFFIGDKLYIGGGYSLNNLNFYEYDLTQGNNPAAWRTLTPLPENMLNGSGFAVGQYGYVQTGETTPAGNDILYQFSTSGPTDPGTWTALGALNIKDGPATSFVFGNTVYFGGGSATATNASQPDSFYSLTPPSTTLSRIAPIPENPSLSPGQRFSTWTSGNLAYLYDSYILTLFTYDPAGDNWTRISTIPTTGRVEYAAQYNGHIYAWDATGIIWEYTGQ